MKIVQFKTLLSAGQFPGSRDWANVKSEIYQAIHSVEWPPGSGSFTLYDELGKERGKGNGVTPIKTNCMETLKSKGWVLESRLKIAVVKRAGAIDATKEISGKHFAVEWETGNISSSHRAMNKMALGMLQGMLLGGVLIVPTAEMAKYLTDRVGNLPELEPYFPLWTSVRVSNGLLGVIAIEQDAVSKKIPKIPKTTAGRALQ